MALCIHTHGEANDLVVPRCLGFFHRLHERPGVLVPLRHKDRIGKNQVCVRGSVCVYSMCLSLTFTCWRMVFRVLYSWSGSFSSFLTKRKLKRSYCYKLGYSGEEDSIQIAVFSLTCPGPRYVISPHSLDIMVPAKLGNTSLVTGWRHSALSPSSYLLQ